MSIESFFITQGIQSIRPATKEAGANGTVTPAPGALNFIDFLFTRISDAGQATPDQNKKGPLTAENSPVIATPQLKITDVLADSDEIAAQSDRDTENFSLDLLTQIANVLSMNQEALKDQAVNDSKLNTLPPEEQKIALQNLMQKFNIPQNASPSTALKLVITQLKEMAADGEPVAITANLTPEQIAFADSSAMITPEQQDIVLTEEQKTELKDINTALLALGFCQIVPPPKTTLAPVLPQTPAPIAPEVAAVATPETDKTKNDMAAKLNNLAVGEEGADDSDSDVEFKSLMQQMNGYKSNAQVQDAPHNKTGKTPAAAPAADMSTVPAWMLPASTALYSPALWTDVSGDAFAAQAATTSITSVGQMTSLVTQAQAATQPLAATQAMAITLQKQAATGENKNFTLQLEPAELGRVEVRLQFGKDKSVKAHMIIEKPETYMMMQRDSHNLERAMQANGIEAGGDASLSFELASQDHDFHQNGSHDNYGGGSSGSKDIETIELPIETTMTWHVDPNTGHMRYRITV